MPAAAAHGTGKLADVRIDEIRPNPENPRVNFPQAELEELQESIRRYGVQVPIAVFKRGGEFILIDGERRWRCASKLNLKTIPALVQDEPAPLENLLLMFNIHALREEWDLLTIALKLPRIVGLLKKELDHQPTETEIAESTGLARGTIRRCRLLMGLPEKYRQMLLGELTKPKTKRVGEDFFIEMEKALKTVERTMPEAIPDLNETRDALLAKYRKGTIASNIEFRKMGRIARATAVGADPKAAKRAIQKLVADPDYSISEAWDASVSEAYAERDIVSRIDALLEKLEGVRPSDVDDDLREKLEELVERAKVILEKGA